MWFTKPNHDVPPCLRAPGACGPKIAKKIKIILITGNVGPTDLRAASNVKTINIEPINTSIVSGLPTLWAKISGGKSGKYKAADTASNAKR